jgi:hypothetical protein
MEMQIYKAQIDPNAESELEVNFIAFVDRPAIERNFQAFKDATPARFALDEDKRIVSGPAMISDMPLYRNDKQLGEYYVVFDKASIYAIATKFAEKGYMKNMNLFHDQQQKVDDVVVFNSFVIDRSIGINPPTGFEDLADGSWFISAKVNNDAVWAKVKAGEIKGFSVEGLFNYVPVAKVMMQQIEKMAAQMSDEQRVEAIRILSETSPKQ